MALRTSKGLIRLVLFLITFQFISPAFASEQGFLLNIPKHPAFNIHIEKSTSLLSLLYEENGTEEERTGQRDKVLTAFELVDFSFLTTILEEVHSTQISFLPFELRYDNQPPLFITHCTFII